MKAKLGHIILWSLFVVAALSDMKGQQEPQKLRLLSQQQTFTAGSPIVLRFSGPAAELPQMVLSGSYGITRVKGTYEQGQLVYHFPDFIAHKKGIVLWQLQQLSGTITIHAQPTPKDLETYVGPPTIAAGDIDYSMQVVIPTDSLDNVLAEGTQVDFKSQYQTQIQSMPRPVIQGVAYLNWYSTRKTGRILVASETQGVNSKEFTIDVLPSIPVLFSIGAKQHHQFADGNQITTFYTTPIQDQYGNIVSDGTYVMFTIRTANGALLKTAGTTVNGVAQADMVHPSSAENWTVKAYIRGAAESQELSLSFKQSIASIQVSFEDHNRTLRIGPLQSFMHQLTPNGMLVKVSILKNNTPIATRSGTSYNGWVTITIPKEFVSEGTYDILVEAGGVSKTYQNMTL